ncbi:transmembrane protein 272-like isoform X2 [Leuresthes tenuis]|uniref:transmembrane protein 272-like isoform X2 n=1 Tax=Leuresthes tenuis TaxID=355514 RepID=UPI003B50A5F2
MSDDLVVLPGKPVLGSSGLITCVMPIAQISIGAVYLNDCPRQHYIPIYLIVTGVFSLALSCFPTAQKSDDGTINRPCATWNSLISSFLFCWFITGNVWIYSIYEPNYNKNTTNVDPYCNKSLYLFAFWTTTLGYILIGVFMVISCCCCCGISISSISTSSSTINRSISISRSSSNNRRPAPNTINDV